jgi:hypothetical protein
VGLDRLAVFALVLALAWAGCRRQGDEELGLRTVVAPTIVLDRLTDPMMLLAALRQPEAELDGRRGPYGFELTQLFELSGDDHGQVRTERVAQAVHFDTDGRGGFHLVRDLDHPDAHAPVPKADDESTAKPDVDPYAQGMEAITLPGRFFVRARYGRFVERRAEPGELERVRALGERLLGDDLSLLLRYATIEDHGAGNLLGRRTRKLALSRRDSPRPAEEGDARRAWRARVTVSELIGELELDGETGAPRRAVLEARYRLPTESKSELSVHLVLRQEPRAAQAIAAPDDALVSPHRSRTTLERNQLLEGLAPPIGTGRP